MNQGIQGAFHAVLAFLFGEHGAQRKGRTHGHQHLGMFRHNGLLVANAQAFLEGAYESRVKGQGATLENHRGLDFHALGKTADGLLGDGVETGKGDVFLGNAVVQHGLDVGLGKHTATARNLVDLLATLRVTLESLGLDTQKFGHLVDKGTRTAGTHAVHAHVRGDKLARGAVLFEEHHLGVLAAQFDSHSGIGVGGAHRKGVGYDFLNEKRAGGVCEGLTAATAKGDPEILSREQPVGLPQHLEDLLGLHGVVALVGVVQKFGSSGIDDCDFHRGRTHVHADP